MSLTKIATETTLQALGGGGIGLLLDSLFPDVTEVHDDNAIRVLAEILGQLVAGGFLTINYYDFLNRRGYGISNNDPTKAGSFLMGYIVSQAKLRSKLLAYNTFLQNQFSNTYIAPSFIAIQTQATGYEKNIEPTKGMDYTTPMGLQQGDFTDLPDE